MKLAITIDCTAHGLSLLVKRDNQLGRGLVVKPARCMAYSERTGIWRGMRIGPVYVRTFAKRPRQRLVR